MVRERIKGALSLYLALAKRNDFILLVLSRGMVRVVKAWGFHNLNGFTMPTHVTLLAFGLRPALLQAYHVRRALTLLASWLLAQHHG